MSQGKSGDEDESTTICPKTLSLIKEDQARPKEQGRWVDKIAKESRIETLEQGKTES